MIFQVGWDWDLNQKSRWQLQKELNRQEVGQEEPKQKTEDISNTDQDLNLWMKNKKRYISYMKQGKILNTELAGETEMKKQSERVLRKQLEEKIEKGKKSFDQENLKCEWEKIWTLGLIRNCLGLWNYW